MTYLFSVASLHILRCIIQIKNQEFIVQWNETKQEKKDPVGEACPSKHHSQVAVGKSLSSWKGRIETHHKLHCPD